MALALSDYRLHAKHSTAVDSATLPPGTTSDAAANQIVNQAGRFLYTCHSWKFRETVSADIDFTASQSYVAMPTSLGQLISIETNSLTSDIRLTAIENLLAMRAKSLVPAGYSYWAALVHPRRANATTAPTPPRLELYPTPAATATAAATIFFRAVWTELAADTDLPDIPLYCESLLIELVRAFADGYMDRHAESGGLLPSVTLGDRVHDVVTSPVFLAAVEEDGGKQPDYGTVGNGLVQSMCGGGLDYLDGRSEATPFIT